MTSNQSAKTGGGRVRRLLTRALLVAGTAATGWLVASGTAAAADAPLLPAPLEGVVDTVDATAKPVADTMGTVTDTTRSTVAAVVEQVVTAPSKARSLAEQDDTALHGAVEGLAGLLKPKQENLIDVPSAVLETLTGSARAATATVQDAGPAEADPANPPKIGGPAKNDVEHTSAVLPAAVVPHGPATAADAERTAPKKDGPETPRFPLPSAPVQVPGSCSCLHDGTGTGGFNVGGFLSAGHNLVVRGQALSAAALHRMAAATAKQPGTTPD
ncbi:hypothetical protein [Allokutzneria oryzae]|uniref:Secreted protein n=1 Tax=Allokutzneria oryzae TaxID=1378989 RepID=A0ABV6A0F7_9PSEU